MTGVPCNLISDWRRQTTSDLTGAFVGPGYNPTLPVYPDATRDYWLTTFTQSLAMPPFPTTNQSFPVQPRGTRPHTR